MAFTILNACSSEPTPPPKPALAPRARVSQEAPAVKAQELNEIQPVLVEQKTKYVSEISFEKGSAVLSTEDRKKLSKIFEESKSKGTIAVVKSLAWSDEEYPSASVKKLDPAESQLAEKRNLAVKRYFEAQWRGLGAKVQTFNMAERPGRLARLFHTQNAEMKKEVGEAGIADSDNSDHRTSMANKGLVMILLK